MPGTPLAGGFGLLGGEGRPHKQLPRHHVRGFLASPGGIFHRRAPRSGGSYVAQHVPITARITDTCDHPRR